jgi:hypothetical protein
MLVRRAVEWRFDGLPMERTALAAYCKFLAYINIFTQRSPSLLY